MRQRAGDPVLVQVGGAGLDVAGVGLKPVVVGGGDPVTEDVHRLRLAGEPGGQLLGDEDVGAVGDLEAAGDRVVVGDRHEVHAAPLREVVDLLRRRRALRAARRCAGSRASRPRRRWSDSAYRPWPPISVGPSPSGSPLSSISLIAYFSGARARQVKLRVNGR